jgi:GT2 family glycosyltransferase
VAAVDLSVVIPVLGRHAVLGGVLRALERQRVPARSFEIVVVADAAEPDREGLAATVGRRAVPTRLLDAPGFGASSARNAGWRAAGAGLVLFLGADIVPRPGLVAAHLAAHEADPRPELAVLGSVRWAARRRTTFMRWLDQGVQFDFTNIDGDRATWAHLYTANVSLQRALLERVGGFDEGFPFLYEDLDLGCRLRDHGLEVRYVPAAAGLHDHAPTLEDWQQRMAAIARAERRFVERHPEMPAYFRDRLADAHAAPRAHGRGRRLAAVVPRRTPWLGRQVWDSVDVWYRQQLAPPFLEAWPGGAAAGSQSG